MSELGRREQSVTASLDDAADSHPLNTKKRGLHFWMCILSIMLASFIMSVDISGVSTALPIIVRDLHGTQFEWVGSAYALAATAFLPLSGGLAQVFGRKLTVMVQLFLFAAGSAICGAAPSLNVLIAGRTIQGIGAGGIASLTQIIISDLVPLHERGHFNALVSLAYCFGGGAAPLIGGALAQSGQWRWFFYLNLPICAVIAILFASFLNLRVPRRSLKEKLSGLDWVGNIIVIGSTTAVVIALTWGGIVFSWDSARVLVPLILGIVGLVVFIVYEAIIPKTPLVPYGVLSSRTAISGYIQATITTFNLIGVFYYLPVYYQGCKDASATASGVDVLSLSFTTMPFGIFAGILVTKTGRYRPQLWLAWVCQIIGFGLFSMLDASSSRSTSIGIQVVYALGQGVLMTVSFFPVLAPIPVSLNANALAFYMFLRFFSQVWGVTVGGAILQNELRKRLPAEFISQFPSGTAVAYSIIPLIPQLQEPLKTNVHDAFAGGLRVFWQVLIGVSGLGLLSSLLMKGLPLHTSVDENYGLKDGEMASDNVGQQGVHHNGGEHGLKVIAREHDIN